MPNDDAARATKGRDSLAYCADQVRRHDHERYLTALFAPARRRSAILALYAFNLEVARIREAVSEPLLGRVRLQWWRDAIGAVYDRGAPPRHPVLEALAPAVHAHQLNREHFDRLLVLEPGYVPDAPRHLALAARLLGYRRAERLAVLYRRMRRRGKRGRP